MNADTDPGATLADVQSAVRRYFDLMYEHGGAAP